MRGMDAKELPEPQWTVITSPPSLAERYARRTLRVRNWQLWPWYDAGILVYFMSRTIGAVRHDQNELAFVYALVALLAFSFGWQRKGFGELFERYDAELRECQHP